MEKLLRMVYDIENKCEKQFLTFFFLTCLTDVVETRIANINEFFTFNLYSNVCRSLFEKHKLMFAFLLCTRIMMNENKIDMVSNRAVYNSVFLK